MKKISISPRLSMLRSFLITTMLLSLVDLLNAVITVEGGGSKIAIVNSSDMKIRVTWSDSSGVVGGDTSIINPDSLGGLTYPASSIIYSVRVDYYKPDGVTLMDTIPFEFSPINLAKSIYVYGDSNVPITSLTPKDEDGFQLPSRSVAWWYGNIDTVANTNVDMVLEDEGASRKLVTMLMMSIDGTNTIIGF